MKKKIISKKNILKIYLSGKNKEGSCVLNRTYIYQISNILLTNQGL
jgi:hypothetical protein